MSETAVREGSESRTVGETSAVVRAVGSVGVGSAVRGEVGSLQVGNLGGVNHAAVVSQGGGTVFQKT